MSAITTTIPTSTGLAHSLPFSTDILAGQLAQSSLAMYRRDVAAYMRFAGSASAAQDATTLARWRAHLAQETTNSPNTINRMLSEVKRRMHEAAEQGYISHEVARAFGAVRGVKIKALKERVKQNARTRISPSDMRKLCNAPDTSTLRGMRDAAMLATLASSGVRVNELATLTTAQIVQRDNGYLLVVQGKNDAEPREAPLSKKAHALISQWLEQRPSESAYIFTSFAGRTGRATSKQLSAVDVWRTVQSYACAADLHNVKPHDFRRFVGTQLAKSDIRKAQRALGHKRIDTTARHYVLDELQVGLTDELY